MKPVSRRAVLFTGLAAIACPAVVNAQNKPSRTSAKDMTEADYKRWMVKFRYNDHPALNALERFMNSDTDESARTALEKLASVVNKEHQNKRGDITTLLLIFVDHVPRGNTAGAIKILDEWKKIKDQRDPYLNRADSDPLITMDRIYALPEIFASDFLTRMHANLSYPGNQYGFDFSRATFAAQREAKSASQWLYSFLSLRIQPENKRRFDQYASKGLEATKIQIANMQGLATASLTSYISSITPARDIKPAHR